MSAVQLNRGLGRGLSALMGEEADLFVAKSDSERVTLPISMIYPNSKQPRRIFTTENLRELSESIKTSGLLQPIIVRQQFDENNEEYYQIIAGERRWRACRLAGLDVVPVIVKNINDLQTLELSIIENIQREDLSPIEEARGYKNLIDYHEYNQEKIAEKVAKSRSHITNILRLLTLPKEIQDLVDEKRLSMGHARALIGVSDNINLAHYIIAEGLSVRDTERMIRDRAELDNQKASDSFTKTSKRSLPEKDKDEDILLIERNLLEKLGMHVSISDNSNGGVITVHYNNIEQLDKIVNKLLSDD